MLTTLIAATLFTSTWAQRAFVESKEQICLIDQLVDGMKFPKYTKLYQLKDGGVTAAVLGGPAMIMNIPFATKTALHFHGSQKIHTATLAERQMVHGITFEKQTEITFNAETGKVQSVRAMDESDPSVNGMKFQRQAVWVHFHQNEKVKSGTLAGDQLFAGMKFENGTEIKLYSNGTVESGVLAEDQTVKGLRLQGITPVSFYTNGALHEATLADPGVVQGLRVIGPITYYENGKVDELQLAVDQTVAAKPYTPNCHAGDRIHFEATGKFLGWSGKTACTGTDEN